MLVVQIVSVWWTKASRGSPGATERNRIPRTFPLIGDLNGPDFVQRHQFREVRSGGFEECGLSHEVLPPLPIDLDGLLLDSTDSEVRIQFKWRYGHGMPPRPRGVYPRAVKSQPMVALLAGESLQLRINGRHVGERTYYTQHTFNVVYASNIAREVFTAMPFTHTLSMEERLF